MASDRRNGTRITRKALAWALAGLGLVVVGAEAGCGSDDATAPIVAEDDGGECEGDECVCEAALCPGEDTQCRRRVCNDTADGLGECAFENLEAGTACTENGGARCVSGTCVPNIDGWKKLAAGGAPTARHSHTAVWTGDEMIVWGGFRSNGIAGDGAVYDVTANAWRPMSEEGAPNARHSHVAVWTGEEMLVWGGYGDVLENTGGRYNPATDTWAAMSTDGAPSGRTIPGAVWTGSLMYVWGGIADVTALADGAMYDPETDTWSPMPSEGALPPRFGHAFVWTGEQIVVWGGTDTIGWLDDGAIYDVATNTWVGNTSDEGVPGFRESASYVWTGSEMLIWGGWNGGPFLNDGSLFDPAAGDGGTWRPMSGEGAPAERQRHSSVWTGDNLFVWGGCNDEACENELADGAVWVPGAGGEVWVPVEESDALSARQNHSTVWTGKDVIVFGGRDGLQPWGDGARLRLR